MEQIYFPLTDYSEEDILEKMNSCLENVELSNPNKIDIIFEDFVYKQSRLDKNISKIDSYVRRANIVYKAISHRINWTEELYDYLEVYSEEEQSNFLESMNRYKTWLEIVESIFILGKSEFSRIKFQRVRDKSRETLSYKDALCLN